MQPQQFHPDQWFIAGHGPRYEQLYRHLSKAIAAGDLAQATQLPPERDLAELAQVSRVTVRKAVAQLVADGVLDQRRGAGTFVRPVRSRTEPYLSKLLSFTEYMRHRGKTPTSSVINQGIFYPTPDEQLALGLSAADRVARIERLRPLMALRWRWNGPRCRKIFCLTLQALVPRFTICCGPMARRPRVRFSGLRR
jgi:GntR family transcriptional regulator